MIAEPVRERRILVVLAALMGLVISQSTRLLDSASRGVAVLGWIGLVLGVGVLAMVAWVLARPLAAEPRKVARVGLVVAVGHLLVVIAHGIAHEALGVELSPAQTVYAAVVIVIGPLLAAALLLTGRGRLGAALLAVSMSGALLFGAYWHYVAITPDHVAHLPAGEAQGLFRVTALLLVLTEVVGVVAGIWGVASANRYARRAVASSEKGRNRR